MLEPRFQLQLRTKTLKTLVTENTLNRFLLSVFQSTGGLTEGISSVGYLSFLSLVLNPETSSKPSLPTELIKSQIHQQHSGIPRISLSRGRWSQKEIPAKTPKSGKIENQLELTHKRHNRSRIISGFVLRFRVNWL